VKRLFLSQNPQATRALGEALGRVLPPGSVLALTGPMGAGKTCFCQGLARGLGVDPQIPVTSPTYTLIAEYPGRIPFFHMDLYRIKGPDDLLGIGFYDILEAGGVTAIEWAQQAAGPDFFPLFWVEFAIRGQTARSICFLPAGQDAADLLNGLVEPGRDITIERANGF